MTKSDHAYQALRRGIVVGEIETNEPLDEADLMARFDTGRTPIREALKRLALEQFVVWPPRRTAYVRETSAHELHRLYESRLLLEEPVSRLAAERITDAGLAELDRFCDELETAAEEGKVYEAVEIDHALHLAIARGSENRFLVDAVRNLNCGSLRLWYVAHEQIGLGDVPAHHRAIVDALRTRDPERAAAETRNHILISHERQLRLQSLPATSLTPAR